MPGPNIGNSVAAEQPLDLSPDAPDAAGGEAASGDLPVSSGAFDYATLPTEIADDARAVAARIRARMRDSIIETGRDLLAMKAKLQHGQFTAWLQGALDINVRSAERYMGAARFANEKGDTVSLLPTAALHLLAAPSAPDLARETAVARLRNGERVTTDDVRVLVQETREAARRAEAQAKRTPEQVAQERERERRRKAAQERARKLQEKQYRGQRTLPAGQSPNRRQVPGAAARRGRCSGIDRPDVEH